MPGPSICASVPNNLIKNCGFEDGDFTGWTVLNDDGNTAVEPASFTPPGTNSGEFYCLFGSLTPCTVQQTILGVPAGTPLTLGFYFAQDTNPFTFVAKWNATTLLDIDSPGGPNHNYVKYSYSVVATGNDTVAFTAQDDIGYLGLDDVSLPYTPPAAENIVVTLIFEGVRRYRIKKPVCLAQRPQKRAAFPPIQPSKPKWTRHGIDFRPERERRQGLVRTSALRSAKT
jgi:hypothetical protein